MSQTALCMTISTLNCIMNPTSNKAAHEAEGLHGHAMHANRCLSQMKLPSGLQEQLHIEHIGIIHERGT